MADDIDVMAMGGLLPLNDGGDMAIPIPSVPVPAAPRIALPDIVIRAAHEAIDAAAAAQVAVAADAVDGAAACLTHGQTVLNAIYAEARRQLLVAGDDIHQIAAPVVARAWTEVLQQWEILCHQARLAGVDPPLCGAEPVCIAAETPAMLGEELPPGADRWDDLGSTDEQGRHVPVWTPHYPEISSPGRPVPPPAVLPAPVLAPGRTPGFPPPPPPRPSPSAAAPPAAPAIPPPAAAGQCCPPCPMPPVTPPEAGEATEPVSLEGGEGQEEGGGPESVSLGARLGQLAAPGRNLLAFWMPNWSRTDRCPTEGALGGEAGRKTIVQALKDINWIDRQGRASFLGKIADGLGASRIPGMSALGDLANSLGTGVAEFLGELDRFAASVAASTGCDFLGAAMPLVGVILADVLERWAGARVPNLTEPARYAVFSACPYILPSIAEAHAAKLGGTITDNMWECWIKANGGYVDPAYKILMANRTRPNVSEVIALHLRGAIDAAQLDDMLRGNGVLELDDRDRFLQLSEFVPGPSDVIRFMVRDVWNADAVQLAGLDTGFEANYTADAERLGAANGLTRDVARMFWRSHFQLPSPTQYFEFLRRLRPGRDPSGVVVTREQVRRGLLQADYAPGWIDAYIAVSYRQLGRTDARRAYMVGAIDRNEFTAQLEDIGFTRPNAERLSASTFAQKRRAAMREKVVRQYQAFSVTTDELRATLDDLGYEDEIVGLAIAAAAADVDAATNGICVKNLRRRYLTGEYNEAEIEAEATALHLDVFQRSQFVARLRCEKNTRGKHIPAQTLCKMYEAGVIDRPEYSQRLVNVGWGALEAELFVRACEVKAGIETPAGPLPAPAGWRGRRRRAAPPPQGALSTAPST